MFFQDRPAPPWERKASGIDEDKGRKQFIQLKADKKKCHFDVN